MNFAILKHPVNIIIVIGVILIVWLAFFQIAQSAGEGKTAGVDPASTS